MLSSTKLPCLSNRLWRYQTHGRYQQSTVPFGCKNANPIHASVAFSTSKFWGQIWLSLKDEYMYKVCVLLSTFELFIFWHAQTARRVFYNPFELFRKTLTAFCICCARVHLKIVNRRRKCLWMFQILHFMEIILDTNVGLLCQCCAIRISMQFCDGLLVSIWCLKVLSIMTFTMVSMVKYNENLPSYNM